MKTAQTSRTFAPAHLRCIGGSIKGKINGGRRYTGPSEATDSEGRVYSIDGTTAPQYSGTCPFCARRVDAARYWEAVLVSR